MSQIHKYLQGNDLLILSWIKRGRGGGGAKNALLCLINLYRTLIAGDFAYFGGTNANSNQRRVSQLEREKVRNIQTPTSKLQRISNHQTTKVDVGIWRFSGGWCLGFGA
jgi:hypothetical protein